MTSLLSVVIPAFNEEDRLPGTFQRLRQYLDASIKRYEVIVVDDGSRDATADLVSRQSALWPALRLLQLTTHSGKGVAVRAGVLDSHGESVAIADADLSAPIDQLGQLANDLCDSEIAILSRAMPGALLGERQSLFREMMGNLYSRFARALVLRGVPDAQCGLKLYRGDLARDIFRHVGESGVVFDTEALALGASKGARISQRPATWSHDPNTRIPFTPVKAIEVGIALLRIKLRHRFFLPVRARGPIRASSDDHHVA